MQIIPVIDIKNGIVVHARQGNREEYAPLQSKICPSTDIFAVINAFWRLFRCPTLYIADLNAITKQNDNAALLAEVLTAFPQITFWIDSGYPIRCDSVYKLDNFIPVFGSESFTNETIDEIKHFEKKFILSLDYSLSGELGSKSLFTCPTLWPENIIIMNLPRVGSSQGPDLTQLTYFQENFSKKTIIAAGGIRDNTDLDDLGRIGIKYALVATALHNGSISPLT